MTDFAAVRQSLAHEREQGRPFSEAWKAVLDSVEDSADRQVLHATREQWQAGYERRESKIRELA